MKSVKTQTQTKTPKAKCGGKKSGCTLEEYIIPYSTTSLPHRVKG